MHKHFHGWQVLKFCWKLKANSAGIDSMWMRKTLHNSILHWCIHEMKENENILRVWPVWLLSRRYFSFPAHNSYLKLNCNYLSTNKPKFKKKKRWVWLKFYGILAPNEASNRRQMCCRGPNANQPSQIFLPSTCAACCQHSFQWSNDNGQLPPFYTHYLQRSRFS